MADARPVRDEKYAAKTLGRRRMITAVGNAHDGPTRYNIGFAFLDYFCEAAGANWTKDRSLRATTVRRRLCVCFFFFFFFFLKSFFFLCVVPLTTVVLRC